MRQCRSVLDQPTNEFRTSPDPDRVFSRYVGLLEQHPERPEQEQTHLFAAMEHASRKNDMNALLRIEALVRRLSLLNAHSVVRRLGT